MSRDLFEERNTASKTAMSAVGTGILSTIGRTPLVRLLKVFQDHRFKLYAKVEAFNPGGSVKDRPALYLIRKAMEEGHIHAKTMIVESSSGNMGIGLAQVCKYFRLQFTCVVDPKITSRNLQILKTYGAEVDVVSEPDPTTGDFLQARIKRVQRLLSEHPNAFWPNQYANWHNAQAHYRTMSEIAVTLGNSVDYLFCATSTCGTIRGCAEFIRKNNLATKVIAVDAVGSVIFGGARANRLIPGYGAAFVPKLHKPDLIDAFISVSDWECIVGCRRLLQEEAILAGGSSGAVLMGVERMKEKLAPGSVCAIILPDRGERYLDTIYCDSWVMGHFGKVPDAESLK
jgi:N-(2-amino-2-carboxyethyl)-L-glutamate synthase